MMEKTLLFSFTADGIKVTIEAYFDENENLIIDGYDIGKRVEEAWGDSDYEYNATISPPETDKVYDLFKIPRGEKKHLLSSLQTAYNTNTCYSEILNLLDNNKIRYEGFSWR